MLSQSPNFLQNKDLKIYCISAYLFPPLNIYQLKFVRPQTLDIYNRYML